MKQSSKVVLLLVSLLLASQTFNRSPKDPNVHFLQFQFPLVVGESKFLPLPRTDVPVRVDISVGNVVISDVRQPPFTLSAVLTFDSRIGLPGGVGSDRDSEVDCLAVRVRASADQTIEISAAIVSLPCTAGPEPLFVTVNMWF